MQSYNKPTRSFGLKCVVNVQETEQDLPTYTKCVMAVVSYLVTLQLNWYSHNIATNSIEKHLLHVAIQMKV